MWQGPEAQETAERTAVLNRIIQELQQTFGDAILVIALYGSMARGDDLPFSDIELFCVVNGTGIDYSLEWVYGAGKVGVNIMSDDQACADAKLLDDDWACWKGQFLYSRLLNGDEQYLQQLRQLVASPPEHEFHRVIEEMIVGGIYEWIGKLRNAQFVGNWAAIPSLACHFVEDIAQILGIAHRQCYTTGSRTLADSLTLPHRPAGYDELCHAVMAGKLDDSSRIAGQIEACWQGLAVWAKECGLTFQEHGAGRWPQNWRK